MSLGDPLFKWNETRHGGRPLRALVFVLTAALLLTTAAMDASAPRPRPPVIGEEKARVDAERAAARIVDGSRLRILERDLHDRSNLAHWAMPTYTMALAKAFKTLGARVYVGDDGFLFIKKRVRTAKGVGPERADLAMDRFARLAEALGSRGTKLVLVFVPRKAEILARHLPDDEFEIHAELTDRFLERGRKQGVLAVDPRPELLSLGSRAYHRTDTHWTDEGCLAAAEKCAAVAGLRVDPSNRPSVTRAVGREGLVGDITRTAGLLRPDGSGCTWLIENAEVWRVVDRTTGELWTAEGGGGPASLVLAGTSYCAPPRRFGEYLEGATRTKVESFVFAGLGAVEPLRRAAQAFGKQGYPKVLVWEVPLYEIFCYEDDRFAPLDDIITTLAAK